VVASAAVAGAAHASDGSAGDDDRETGPDVPVVVPGISLDDDRRRQDGDVDLVDRGHRDGRGLHVDADVGRLHRDGRLDQDAGLLDLDVDLDRRVDDDAGLLAVVLGERDERRQGEHEREQGEQGELPHLSVPPGSFCLGYDLVSRSPSQFSLRKPGKGATDSLCV